MRRSHLILCNLVIWFAICQRASAQNSCDAGSIDSAKYRYEIGQLDECVQGLRRCLSGGNSFTPEQKVQAYHILAKCCLVLDQVSVADSVITELLSLKENFEPDPDDPEILKNEVTLIKANIVSSVSKFSEDIRLAPATVIVITREEILQRGYADLIDVLRDIPGFDISVYYGQLYANVYQRGFRSNNTDKTLLMIDGVEENDLWSNFADISQQYPLSNIKRVEVVYGPASTMYGPNAFSGVINVITKEPADYLKDKKTFGLNASAGIGTYSTRYIDLSTAYKKGDFSFSVTGRMYYSDRPDLSSQILWDYDPNVIDDTAIFRYKNMRIGNGQEYINVNHLQRSPFYVLRNDTIRLTGPGIEEAKRLNREFFCPGLEQSDFSKFYNPASASYLNARFNIGDLSFGFLTWGKSEGNGTTYTDLVASVSGSEWKPAHTTAYMSYTKRINVKLRFSAFLNYKIHTIRNGSKITTIESYSPFGGLELKDLINGIPAHWLTTYYYEQSEQYKSEFKLLYNQSKYFYLISGIELRNSQLQGYYLTDTISVPQNTGSYPHPDLPGGNHYNVNDIGVYTQGNYRTKNGFGFTAGIRFDHNEIRQGGGLGTQISPRFVVDYSNKNKGWVFKAIMSKGVQNVSNYTKFDDVIVVPNPSLTYEAMYNYEISGQKNISKEISADIDFFYSKIDNVVGAVLTRNALQNQNIGEDQIKGIQSNLYYKSGNQKWNVLINYTYTDPKQTRGIDANNNIDSSVNLRIGDIASHKINTIVNFIPLKNFNINLRINYVGSKKAGDSTSVPRNTINSFDGYILSHITIGFRNLVKGSIIQVGCNNIFNKACYSPGIRTAGGIRHPSEILQMGRTFFFKIGYEF